MIILRYNKQNPVEEISNIAWAIRDKYDEDVIVIPYNMDLLFNCSIEELKSIRNYIDDCINKKEEK